MTVRHVDGVNIQILFRFANKSLQFEKYLYICRAMEAGRPTKYQTSYNQQAYKLCLLGAIDKDLADWFDVNTDTINEWKKVYPKFKASIQKGKKIADIKVAESLFRTATGFDTEEVTFEKSGDKQTVSVSTAGEIKADDEYKKKVVTKFIPGNVTAQKFWLINRDKENWREKQEIEVTNKIIEVLAPPEEDDDDA